LFATPKDGQGSFSSKSCHDNYWYYVHPKNGMASLDMSDRDEATKYSIDCVVCKYIVLHVRFEDKEKSV